MPRANRYFLSDHVWHITHRCHKREFLLKFSRDRTNWENWLFEARKRYRIEILNYSVTSNHIHLLVYGNEDREVIPRSLQLVAGRTAQAYNRQTKPTREKAWTEALAVGRLQFVEAVKKRLGIRATYRSIKENPSITACILQESAAAYNPHFGDKMVSLSTKNSLPWHNFSDM